MLTEGLLTTSNDKYAILKVTAEADAVLRGNRPVIWKRPKAQMNQNTERRISSARLRKSDILNSKGLELFDRLRALRTEIAREESMPPYIIFSDKTLVDMCVRAPLEKREMMQVTGVGESKYKRYGERFLAVIADYTGGVRQKYYFGDEAAAVAQTAAGQKNRVQKGKEADFYLTNEQAQAFPFAEKYLVVELAEKLNELRDADMVKKISGAEIFRRIQEKGYAGEKMEDGIRKKYVTRTGQESGLFLGMRLSKKGTEYEDIYYNEKAQEMIVAWMKKE